MQEFIPAQDAHIVRVEVLNGKFLYAIKVHITGETFDLCPADICRTTTGTDLNRGACAIDAPKSGITVEAFTPPADAIADVENIMQHSGIDIGGVEYITDSRDGQRYYYDTNALSNFVADGPNVIGFDPFAKLVDWLEAEAGLENPCSTARPREEQQALAAELLRLACVRRGMHGELGSPLTFQPVSRLTCIGPPGEQKVLLAPTPSGCEVPPCASLRCSP